MMESIAFDLFLFFLYLLSRFGVVMDPIGFDVFNFQIQQCRFGVVMYSIAFVVLFCLYPLFSPITCVFGYVVFTNCSNAILPEQIPMTCPTLMRKHNVSR